MMMSLDKEPAALPEKPSLLCHKNGLQAPPPPPARPMGKRRCSVGVAFRGPAKRRRRANTDSQSEPVLPSHFLLGGNIFDPLNLNSLLDEEVNRTTNQETPKCSPLPKRGGDPVEILVPRDITDPLNLKGGGEDGEDGGGGGGVLLPPLKARRRHRYRHHGGGGAAAGGGAAEGGAAEGAREVAPSRLFPPSQLPTVPLFTIEDSVPPSPLPCELNTAITCRDDVAPPPILPRRHTHPPPGPVQKPGSHGDGHHRRRRRTTSARSMDVTLDALAFTATAPQHTKFQTPLVGGAKGVRCGGPQLGNTGPPQKKKDKHRYQYGNHSCYYGYHGFYGDGWEGRVGVEEDPRLRLLEADWFRDKTVLDVGCGAGHLTLAVARRFNPTHILGVELDRRLVHAANQNIRHFLSHDLVVERRRTEEKKEWEGLIHEGEELKEQAEPKEEDRMDEGEELKKTKEAELMEVISDLHRSLTSFPLSFRVSRGPLAAPPLLLPPSYSSASSRFPNNVTFIQGDYVSVKGAWPGQGLYDVIMCLGVTKWVQLQWGDEGVVRLFKRAYQSLSPGGIFILEPQPWKRYSHSKRASEKTLANFRSSRLRPESFTSFLTDVVGFSSYRIISSSGNKRPIYLFHKGSAHRK
ncbi:7SK snRNA methylphosphate capping enzyme [Pholidichthys leucotaenia]